MVSLHWNGLSDLSGQTVDDVPLMPSLPHGYLHHSLVMLSESNSSLLAPISRCSLIPCPVCSSETTVRSAALCAFKIAGGDKLRDIIYCIRSEKSSKKTRHSFRLDRSRAKCLSVVRYVSSF
jgi:hypothetical protein